MLELYSYLMLASATSEEPSGARGAGAGGAGAAPGRRQHERGDGTLPRLRRRPRHLVAPARRRIPKFSPVHCSTGTVLLVQALLTCRSTRLYGYHSCACEERCSAPAIAQRNHYWNDKATPKFDQMMSRYEHHMLFYQLLERSCGLDFKIARKEHCDRRRAAG